jgi:predicted permease
VLLIVLFIPFQLRAPLLCCLPYIQECQFIVRPRVSLSPAATPCALVLTGCKLQLDLPLW